MKRPRIGITSNIAPDEHQPDRIRCYVNSAYVDAIFAAGGLPLVLPPPPVDAPLALMDELLATCDGILFTGGPDLDPRHYGQARHAKTEVLPARRDHFEVEFFRRADQTDAPILAICLGCQVANVARGGALVQHVDDLPRTPAIEHYKPDHSTAYHPVTVQPDTRLAAILGTRELEVNSRHHQVLDAREVGGRLRPVAFAPDGVVEAAEGVDRRFMVAVQWHPEDMIDRPEHLRLFEALVQEAVRRR